MERLITLSEKKKKGIHQPFRRYLFEQIDWTQRLILVLGHRGVGKTTLLIQHMQNVHSPAVYLSLDDFYFESNRLAELIEQLYEKGCRNFYIDEAHRYRHWSTDLKIVYDNLPDAYFIVSGSSILALKKGKGDLSRRAAVYHLEGLSFREFLLLEKKLNIQPLSLPQILEQHETLSADISDRLQILTLFREYLEYGYYPFYLEGKKLYKSRLTETTQVVIEMDLSPLEDLSHQTIRNMKK